MKTLIVKSRMLMKAEKMEKWRDLFLDQAQQGLVLLPPEFDIEAVPEEWIECKRVNPEPYSELLFCDQDGIVYAGTRDNLGRYLTTDARAVENVIAWMPAPKAYKGE